MRNIIKLLSGVLLVAMVFSSCDKDQEGAKLNVNKYDTGVGFLQTEQTVSVDPNVTTNAFDINVARGSFKADATYDLTITTSVEDFTDKFTVPATVSFDAGSATAKITFQADAEELVAGTNYVFTVTVKDVTNASAATAIKVTAALKINWQDVGAGSYDDGFFYNAPVAKNLQKAEGLDYYRIVDAVRSGYSFTFFIDSANAITVPAQQTGYVHSTYGMISVMQHDFGTAAGMNVYDGAKTYKFGVLHYDPSGPWTDPEDVSGVDSIIFTLN